MTGTIKPNEIFNIYMNYCLLVFFLHLGFSVSILQENSNKSVLFKIYSWGGLQEQVCDPHVLKLCLRLVDGNGIISNQHVPIYTCHWPNVSTYTSTHPVFHITVVM